MKILALIFLVGIIFLLLALLYYLLVGALLFKFVLSRKSVTDRLMRRNIQQDLNKYKIDLCWWDKHKFVKVFTQSFDQLKLVGYFYKANSNNTVIIVHGFGQYYKEMQLYCKYFFEKNFNVLVVDNRAHGESEGKYTGFGWLDRKDVLSWVEFLNEKNPTNNICLFGLSMGGTAVLGTLSEDLPTNVKAIISDCAFASADKEIEYVVRNHKLVLKFFKKHLYSYAKRVYGLDLMEANVLQGLKNAKIPVLLIHGSSDDYVPFENLNLLYNSLPSQYREKYIVDGATHAMSFPVAGIMYEKKIGDFFKSRTKIPF